MLLPAFHFLLTELCSIFSLLSSAVLPLAEPFQGQFLWPGESLLMDQISLLSSGLFSCTFYPAIYSYAFFSLISLLHLFLLISSPFQTTFISSIGKYLLTIASYS